MTYFQNTGMNDPTQTLSRLQEIKGIPTLSLNRDVFISVNETLDTFLFNNETTWNKYLHSAAIKNWQTQTAVEDIYKRRISAKEKSNFLIIFSHDETSDLRTLFMWLCREDFIILKLCWCWDSISIYMFLIDVKITLNNGGLIRKMLKFLQ